MPAKLARTPLQSGARFKGVMRITEVLMRFLSVLVPMLLVTSSYASCLEVVSTKDIELKINRSQENHEATSGHLPMELISIQVSSEYRGATLDAMLLTKGEIPEFWIPVEFKVHSGTASATLHSYSSFLENLEMAFYYKDSHCSMSTQVLLQAHNKTKYRSRPRGGTDAATRRPY